jgi:polyphenol oxidase
MNRRQFVGALGQGSVAAMLGLRATKSSGQTSGHELPVNCSPPTHGAAKHITFSSSATILPRKSVWDLSSTEVTRLQTAYQALRNLTTSNPNDPRGWMQQGNVHCFNCSGGYDPSNIEIHGSWWFLPWHRCYLYVHERILGSLINDTTFRLAYWDWDTYPKHASVPPPFMASGSLLDIYRGAKATDIIPSSITGPAHMKIVMGTQGTKAFMGGPSNSGAMENNPHGPVHIWTGETSPSQSPIPPGCFYPNTPGGPPVDQSQDGCLDMGVLATAAQDPVFFAHHSNIDRLWDVWLNTPGVQGNWTTTTWLNHKFNFYDENGDWVYITVADVLKQQEQNNLRYSYQPPQTAAPLMLAQAPVQKAQVKILKPVIVAARATGTAVGTKPHVKSIALPKEHRQNLKALAAGGARRYLLHIDGIRVPANESALLDVFVGEPNATRDTEIGPSFVGTFSVVVSGTRHTHNTMRNAVFELRPETAALLADQTNLTVTLVPKLVDGTEPQKSSLTYRRIYLSTE